MPDPISLGTLFASMGSAFKIADLYVRVAEVGSENEVFVRTIRVVRDDLNEVQRLVNTESVQKKLRDVPEKKLWVQRAIYNTGAALNEIGKWAERARCESQSAGSIQFNTRIRWILNDHEKLVNRTKELTTCHQQLSSVLHYLIPLEEASPANMLPSLEKNAAFDEILSRVHGRRTICTPKSIEILPVKSDGLPARYRRRSAVVMTDDPSPAMDVPATVAPPLSPPPSYASILQSTPAPSETRVLVKPQAIKSLEGSTFDTLGPAPRSDYHNQVWAYRSSARAVSVPELAGDTVRFSATNSLGPVNPFEFCVDLAPVPIKAEHLPQKAKHSTELPGDTVFPVELPGSTVMPSQEYPRPVSQHTSYAYNRAHSTPSFHHPVVPMFELSAMPARKPLPFAFSSKPAVCSESETLLKPRASTLACSSSHSLPMMNPDCEHRRSASQPCDDTTTPTQRISNQTPQSVSSARMHHQKQMMQFLGSIDS